MKNPPRGSVAVEIESPAAAGCSPFDHKCEITSEFRRSSSLKRATRQFSANLRALVHVFGQDAKRVAKEVYRCANWLFMREGILTGNMKWGGATFCHKRGVCVFCDAYRALVARMKILPAIEKFLPSHSIYLMTLTLRSVSGGLNMAQAIQGGYSTEELNRLIVAERGALQEQMRMLWSSFGRLWRRARKKNRGVFRHVQGWVGVMEITHTENGWHAHLHIIIVCERGTRVEVMELRREWEKLTGACVVDLKHIKSGNDLVEVFKYSVKPHGTLENREEVGWVYLAHKAITRERLMRTGGILYPIPVEFQPEDAIEVMTEEVIRHVYRWIGTRNGRYRWHHDDLPEGMTRDFERERIEKNENRYWANRSFITNADRHLMWREKEFL